MEKNLKRCSAVVLLVLGAYVSYDQFTHNTMSFKIRLDEHVNWPTVYFLLGVIAIVTGVGLLLRVTRTGNWIVAGVMERGLLVVSPEVIFLAFMFSVLLFTWYCTAN